jgi:hypothetical protein
MMMGIKQHGGFLELGGEDGVRNLVRINAVQWLCDADETREETFLTVANRTILVREPLDQIKLALRSRPARI